VALIASFATVIETLPPAWFVAKASFGVLPTTLIHLVVQLILAVAGLAEAERATDGYDRPLASRRMSPVAGVTRTISLSKIGA
jgi:hypothetical protein